MSEKQAKVLIADIQQTGTSQDESADAGQSTSELKYSSNEQMRMFAESNQMNKALERNGRYAKYLKDSKMSVASADTWQVGSLATDHKGPEGCTELNSHLDTCVLEDEKGPEIGFEMTSICCCL